MHILISISVFICVYTGTYISVQVLCAYMYMYTYICIYTLQTKQDIVKIVNKGNYFDYIAKENASSSVN